MHGIKGPVQVSLGGYIGGVDRRVIDTTREFVSEFPYNIDMNSGYPLGIGQAASVTPGTTAH
jgi:choline dehydrogenase